jgi:hypothetical protein
MRTGNGSCAGDAASSGAVLSSCEKPGGFADNSVSAKHERTCGQHRVPCTPFCRCSTPASLCSRCAADNFVQCWHQYRKPGRCAEHPRCQTSRGPRGGRDRRGSYPIRSRNARRSPSRNTLRHRAQPQRDMDPAQTEGGSLYASLTLRFLNLAGLCERYAHQGRWRR